MKRQELVEMMDEGQFLTLLSEAKVSEEVKISIAKEHYEWQRQQILAGKPYRTAEMTVKGEIVKVGQKYIDPYSGRLRINVGR